VIWDERCIEDHDSDDTAWRNDDGPRSSEYVTRRPSYNLSPRSVKQRHDDFRVVERPLYELEGAGPHLYFEVTKRGITTLEAIQQLANYMDVSKKDVGRAGRKDAQAVTTQRMSIEHADEEQLSEFESDEIEVSVLDWHRNKLQPGHLLGNQFSIRLREFDKERADRLDRVIDRLYQYGVPNYFGEQRFGRRGDTAELGELLLRDQLEEFVDKLLGNPRPADPEPIRKARRRYEQQQYERAMDCWPSGEGIHRRALATYMDRGAPKPVLSALPKSRRRLFVEAFQSRLFNKQVALRIDTLDRVRTGGIAKKTDTGGMFEIEDEESEQPRANRFEISPTGSLPGADSWKATGRQGELERSVLKQYDLSYEDFDKVQYLGINGARRPLRFKPENLQAQVDEDNAGEFLEVEFFAPSGSYATVLLRELQLPV